MQRCLQERSIQALGGLRLGGDFDGDGVSNALIAERARCTRPLMAFSFEEPVATALTVDMGWRMRCDNSSRRSHCPAQPSWKIGTSYPRIPNHRCEPIDAMVQNRRVGRRATGGHCGRGAVVASPTDW